MWTDPQKLEKQISLMEQHPEYALTATDYNTIDENGTVLTEWRKDFDKNLNGRWYETMILKDYIGALTLVFTREAFDISCKLDDYISIGFKTPLAYRLENNAIPLKKVLTFHCRKYKVLADNTKNVIFGGRLAEYKYYDMDDVIAEVLKKNS